MKKRNHSTRNGGGRPRARFGTRAVALVAAFALVMSMCPGAAALAYANGQLAGGSAGLEAQGGGEALTAQAGGETAVTKDTHSMKTGTYVVAGDVTIEPDETTGNGIQVEKGANVLLVLEAGAKLTVTGADAKGAGTVHVGHAAFI